MAIIELNSKTEFPKGKIILMDGRLVDCFPKAIADSKDQSYSQSASDVSAMKREQELDKERFIKNAFYFLAHKERILTDSRMFLCPVPIQSGLSISGTSGFMKPTLGVYLQWWMACPSAMRTDKKGRKSLVYHIAGSNLSGSNHCAEVYEDGKTKDVSLYPFSEVWKSFGKINTAYTEAKELYQAYTIRQVLEILDHEESGDSDYAKSLDAAYFTHEIDALNAKMVRMEENARTMSEKLEQTSKSLREEKMLRFYAEYRVLEVQTDFELEILQQRKRDMKAALHNGELTNELYQRRLNSLNTRIKEIEQELSDFKFKRILEVFPNNDVAFYQIKSFIDSRNENHAEENSK